MENIFKWSCSTPKKQAGLTILKGIDGQWAIDIKRGRKLAKPLPAEAYFEMNPKRLNENKLGEQHTNIEGMVVIGARLSQFVRDLKDDGIELLPVKIHDHNGKVASSDYHIVHTTRVIDCIDTKASGAIWNAIDPESMMSWNTLILKPGDHKFPKLFRIKHTLSSIYVREDVAKAIEALNLQKPYLKPLENVT